MQQLFTGGRSERVRYAAANVAENREPNSFFNWVTLRVFRRARHSGEGRPRLHLARLGSRASSSH